MYKKYIKVFLLISLFLSFILIISFDYLNGENKELNFEKVENESTFVSTPPELLYNSYKESNKYNSHYLSTNINDNLKSSEVSGYSSENAIMTSKLYTFDRYSDFSGNQLTNPFNVEDFSSIEITDFGGIHTDGTKKKVYSNYVKFRFIFNIDSYQSILNTGFSIVKCTDKKVSGHWMGLTGKYKFQNTVNYGVVVVSRENADGTFENENPIYLSGAKSSQVFQFVEDGNYYIRIFVSIKNYMTSELYNCVAEHCIPIRTSVYVKDLETGFDVKESKAYYGAIKIDGLDRQNVYCTVNGLRMNSTVELTNPGNYRIKVYGNGFLSEDFTYRIYSASSSLSEPLFATFKNLRRVVKEYAENTNGIGYAVYEAENYFEVKWVSKFDDIKATYTFNDSDNPIEFQNGERFDKPGTYSIEIKINNIDRIYYYYITLVEDDLPMMNYEKLSNNRFNNFVTKWYQVYDINADEYYCFSLSEYGQALNAALSIERDLVVDKGYEFIYRGVTYESITQLTPILIDYAKKSVEIKYYDYRENVSKVFSNKLFEEIIYLNSDFKFVSSHQSEVSVVYLIDELGRRIDIEFDTEIGLYNLEEGKYIVIEEDLYKNQNSYVAYIDKSAPEFKLSLNGSGNYISDFDTLINARYFELKDIVDVYDKWAVFEINGDFYLSDELEGVVFTKSGIYNITAYDRNGNIRKVSINIVDKFYSFVENNDNTYLLKLNDGILIDSVFLNGEEVLLESYYFYPENEDKVYLIYFSDSDGNSDCLSFEISSVEEKVEMGDSQTLEDSIKYNIPKWLVYIITYLPFVLLLFIGVMLSGKE